MCFNSLYSLNSLMTLWYTAKAGYSSQRVINTMVSGVSIQTKFVRLCLNSNQDVAALVL